MTETAQKVLRWLARRPGYMMMTAGTGAMRAEDPNRFRSAGWELMLLGTAWGAAMAALYSVVWANFGEYTGIHLIPVAAVVSASMLWIYRRSAIALATLLTPHREQEHPTLGVSVIVLVLALGLLGIHSWKQDWPVHPHWALHWIPPVLFRVLFLAPIWGAWTMLIVPQFFRDSKRDDSVKAMSRRSGPLAGAFWMAILLALTLFSFRTLGGWHWTISAWTLSAAIFGGLLLAWRDGGPTRRALLAGNLLTQIVFLLAYLALIR